MTAIHNQTGRGMSGEMWVGISLAIAIVWCVFLCVCVCVCTMANGYTRLVASAQFPKISSQHRL